MKKLISKLTACILAAAVCVSLTPRADAFTPYADTVRVGLYYGSSALAGANLQNVTGYGSGYEFGYFNSDLDFVSVGAVVDETKISMLKDVNMCYSPSENTYFEGTTGSVVVGCFHIRLVNGYETYEEARAAADTFTSVNAYPKYENGVFYVCAGAYTSADDASAQAQTLGIQSEYDITSGTSSTIAVVATGTSKILFEFDCGTDKLLGVRPVAGEDGQKTQTWFKGYKYYGAFRYSRIGGGALTVVNIVPLEDYVKGVIPYEMSPSWPKEALKAQAVCARTYFMSHVNAHKSGGFDICNTTCCQVYRGTTSANSVSNAAVDETANQYLMYDGSLCETYYYSCNGGASENSENVWSNARPYLIGKEDPYEADIVSKISSYYNWSVTYTPEQLTQRLRNKGYSISTVSKLEVVEFTPMGNVYKIKITDVNGKTLTFTRDSVRTILGAQSPRYTINGDTPENREVSLYVNGTSGTIAGSTMSSSYAVGSSGASKVVTSNNKVYAITGTGATEEVATQKDVASAQTGKFVITGTGSGHNVGMSQWGAYSMAQYHGKTCEEILTFYYTGTEIVTGDM